MFRYFKTVLIFTLVLVTALLVPTQAIAAANNGKYVSEVYVAYGKDAEEAKKTLEDKGFTPVEGNLNDGGKTYSMLGYKTTNEIRDSITDLAVMNMRGDFSVEEYKTLLKSQKTQIAEFLEEFMAVIQEYRVNLKAGKEKATYVHDLLNNYKDDDTGMLMGDLLNSETLQDKVGVAKSIEVENPDKLPDLVTILLQGNTQVIKSMEVLLSMATDTADNSWLDRFAESDYDTLLDAVEDERPDLNTDSKRVQYLENLYEETAGVLGVEVASLREQFSDYEASGLTIDTASAEDIKNAFGDIENDFEAETNYLDWLATGTVYEGLKAYEGGNYAAGEMLDFFMEENDPDDSEIFIPMAAALSDGQRSGMIFVSLTQLLTYAFTDEAGWKQFADKNKTEFDGFDTVSVYQNIDRDVYKEDGSVALTDSAQRAENTATGTTGTQEEQMDALSMITAIGWAATAGLGIASFASLAIRNKLIDAYEANPFTTYENAVFDFNEYQMIKSDYPVAEHNFVSGIEYEYPMKEKDAADKLVRLNRAHYSVIIYRTIAIVTLAIAVATTVLTIIDLCRDKSIEQLPIPKYLVDNYTNKDGGSYTLNYKAVECNREEYFGEGYTRQKGSSADLNADEGKQWLVLYASKNSKAGKPITPDFVIQESNQAPSGYEGAVHLFGEKGAVNVVSGAFKNYSTFSQTWQNIAGDYTMYIFMKLSKDVKTYDESAGNMTATAMSRGKLAIFGVGGLALGAALGAAVTVLVRKKKMTEA